MPSFRNNDTYQAVYQAAVLIAAAHPTFTSPDIMELLGVEIVSPRSDAMRGVDRGYWRMHPQGGEYRIYA